MAAPMVVAIEIKIADDTENLGVAKLGSGGGELCCKRGGDWDGGELVIGVVDAAGTGAPAGGIDGAGDGDWMPIRIWRLTPARQCPGTALMKKRVVRFLSSTLLLPSVYSWMGAMVVQEL